MSCRQDSTHHHPASLRSTSNFKRRNVPEWTNEEKEEKSQAQNEEKPHVMTLYNLYSCSCKKVKGFGACFIKKKNGLSDHSSIHNTEIHFLQNPVHGVINNVSDVFICCDLEGFETVVAQYGFRQTMKYAVGKATAELCFR